MTGRELVDYIIDERGIVVVAGSAACLTFDQQFRQDWGNLIDKKIAEAKAEALREAADRVVAWYLAALDDPGVMTTDDLRAAITGEPPAGDARG